jgi:ribulose-5-phosphate 4-epimerase/fuculose-1-phosphate aldolase
LRGPFQLLGDLSACFVKVRCRPSSYAEPVADACIFYRQVSIMSSSTDSSSVSAALGLGKALLVTDCGQMTASVSIESAVSYFIRIENLCKAQVYAEAAARGRGEKPVAIGDDECQFTWEKTGDEAHGSALALPYFARVERKSAGSHLQ